MTNFQQTITDWILNELSTPVPLLNNLPKCPYAKKAALDGKLLFYEHCDDIDKLVNDIISVWNDESTEVAIINLGNISSDMLENHAKRLNKRYPDFLFLDDHTEVVEKIEDVDFSNGEYNILLCQKREKVEIARKILKRKGYYKNWPKEYYDSVTSL